MNNDLYNLDQIIYSLSSEIEVISYLDDKTLSDLSNILEINLPELEKSITSLIDSDTLKDNKDEINFADYTLHNTKLNAPSNSKIFHQISDWLGPLYNINKIYPIAFQTLLSTVDNARSVLLNEYGLSPFIFQRTNNSNGHTQIPENILNKSGIKSPMQLSYWQLYSRLTSYISETTLMAQIEEDIQKGAIDKNDHDRLRKYWNVAVIWIQELVRLPIRIEALRLAAGIITYKNYTASSKSITKAHPDSFLYVLSMLLQTNSISVLYCGYDINPKVTLHCANDQGRRGNLYRRIAKLLAPLLKYEHHINQAYLIDLKNTHIILPYVLGVARTSNQIILFGIKKYNWIEPQNLLIETIVTAGFTFNPNQSIVVDNSQSHPDGECHALFSSASFSKSNKIIGSPNNNQLKAIAFSSDHAEFKHCFFAGRYLASLSEVLSAKENHEGQHANSKAELSNYDYDASLKREHDYNLSRLAEINNELIESRDNYRKTLANLKRNQRKESISIHGNTRSNVL